MINYYNSLSDRTRSKLNSQETDVVGSCPNKSSLFTNWWRLSLFVLLFVGVTSNAQFGPAGSYTFANTTSPFSTIVGGTGTVAVTLTSLDDSISGNIAMPFGFNFSSTGVSNFQINSNGWLGLNTGTALVSTTNYSALNGTLNNVISVFNRDLNGNNTTSTSYFYQVTGSAPNRILKVEWVNVRSFSGTVNPQTANFQVWLYETSNVVEMHYGGFTSAAARTTAGTVQVGLRGASTAAANVRSLSNTAAWATPTVGTASASTNALGTFATPFLPDSGRTYTFTPPLVVTPPNCATALMPTNGALNVARNTMLSWTAATGSPASYDIFLGTSSPAAFLANVTTTSYTLPSLLLANTSYFYKIVPKNANGDAVGCVEQSFLTGTNVVYCTPTYASGPFGDEITNVSLGSLSNSSGASTTPFYTFFNAVAIPNLQQGSSSSVSISFGSDGGQFAGVWIDYNQNGTFEASEGVVTTTTAGANGTAIVSLSIPAGAVLGNTRMRIRGGDDVALTTAQACGASNSGFGETEDYTVNILPAPTCFAPTGLTSSTITNNSAIISWNAASVIPGNGYDYYFSTSNVAPTAMTTPSGNTSSLNATLTSLNGTTQYFFWVRSNCSISDQSTWAGFATFTTQILVPTPYSEGFTGFTTPTGWNTTGFSVGTTVAGNPGSSIAINLWSFTTTGNFSVVTLGPVLAGQVLSFDYKLGNFADQTVGPGTGTGNYAVQISTDFGSTYTNLDLVANDSDVTWRNKLYSLAAYTGQNIKLRFLGTWISGDYYLAFDNITVAQPCSGIPTGGTVAPLVQRVCPGLPVLPITATGFTTDIGIALQWEQSLDSGANWTNAVGGTGATTATYTPPTYNGGIIQYRLRVTCSTSTLIAYSAISEINSGSNPLPLNESFSDINTLGGWTVTGGYAIGTARGATGNPGANAFSNLSTTNTSNSLTTARFGPVQAGQAVSFDLKLSNFATPFAPPAAGWGTLTVQISTDCGANFTAVGTISDTPTAGYKNYKYDLGSYVGQGIVVRISGAWLTGSFDVSVDNLKIDFTEPVISSFTPSSTCSTEGGSIVLTGYGFAGTSSVLVGTTSVAYSVVNNTTLNVTVPPSFTAGTYTLYATNTYGTGSSTTLFTVNQSPIVAPIVGLSSVCSPNTVALSSSTALGVWSSSNQGVATVDAAGLVTSISAGSTTISYTVTDNGCSTAVTYVVNVYEPVIITTQPTSAAVVTNNNTTFSVVATGSGLTYQWQVSTDGGSTFSNVTDNFTYSGSNSATLTITSAQESMNGYEYQCIVTGTAPCNPETSNSATLSVGNTGITTNPTNVNLCDSGTAMFTVVASGTINSYQWYEDNGVGAVAILNGGDYSGANSATLTISNANNTRNGYTYYVDVVGPANTVSSAIVTLNIATGVSITAQPLSTSVCRVAGTATFNVSTSGTVSTIVWQTSLNGTTGWTNVGSGTAYSVNVTATSTVGFTYYRALVNGNSPCPSLISSVASLEIVQPTITVFPSAATYCTPGTAVSLAASGASTYTWSPSAGLSATTGSNVSASPLVTTIYTVTGTDGAGCVGSTTVTVTVSNAVTASASSDITSVCTGGAVQLDSNGSQAFTPSNIGAYTFANSTAPFQTIVGGTGTTAVTLTSLDDSISAVQTLPFTFNFGGTNFTTYKINSNGWLNLGGLATTGTNYNALNGSDNNVIAAFNRDLNGNNTTSTSYYVQTTGTAPNRITKVEWVNLRSFSGTVNPQTANFQVWLYEGSNKIDIRYGSFTSSSARTVAGTVQVGLRGASNASVNVRSLANVGSWATPTPSTTSTSTVALGTFAAPLLPDDGRVYSFTPGNTPTFTYAWTSTPAGFTSTLKNPVVNPTVSTTYNVVVSSPSTCNSTASVNVTVVSDAVIVTQPTTPAPICQGTGTTLTVSATGPGLTYQWYFNGNPVTGNASATTASLLITAATVAQSGNYNVIVTPACGMIATSNTVALLVNPTPTAIAPANQSYCFGSSISPISLSGTPSGVVYDISGGASVGLANQTGVSQIPSFTGIVGTATVTITPSANGCIGLPVNYTVTVNPLPNVPTLGSNSPICEGTTLNLTASPQVLSGYSVNPNSGVSFIDISTSGTSVGIIADDSEHYVTLPSTFNYNAVPYTTAAIGNNGVMVLGATTGNVYWVNTALPQAASGALSGLGDAGATAICAYWDDLTPGTGASITTQTVGNKYIVQWTNEDSFAATGSGTITFQIQLDLISGQIHLVYQDVVFAGATVNDNGASATVGLNYSATSAQQYSFNTASLVNGQSISYTPNALSYSWSGPNSFTSNVKDPSITSATLAATGTYTVTVTNSATGCFVTATQAVVVNPNVTYYQDADGDTFGNIAVSQITCTGAPVGYVTNNTDCNDSNPTMNATFTFYTDADGDGFGSTTATPQVLCAVNATTPPGANLSPFNTDCDDTKNNVNPAAADVCYDGLDNNCDGIIDNGCVPIITVVQSTQCGSTLATIDQDIFANVVAGAQGYRFRVTDMSTMQVQTIDKALRVFKLTQLSNYKFNTTYQVEVSVRRFNVWQPFYGAPCSVTTPATTTQLQSSQCGGTITAMGDVIYANLVPFATGYRFRVINLLTSNVQVLDRALREFRMNLLVNPQYNTQYSVEVAVRNTDGTYLPYGTICTITTPVFPTTSLQNSQCDYTATSASETIFATSFSGATTYRFRFVNTGLGYTYTFDRPIRSFVLNTVPGLTPATTYSVQVSLELNGEFGPYGKVCSLTTPGSVARAIEKGATASAFKATAYPNPYDNAFNLNVATSSDSIIEVRVYDMIGKLIETQKVEATAISTLQIGERYPSGVYNVIVSQGDQSQNVRVIKR